MQPTGARKRKFTTTQLSTVKGKVGDLVVDSTKKTAVVMDGTTLGGVPLARADAIPGNSTSSTAGLMTAAQFNSLAALALITNATETVSGYMSAADKTTLDSLSSASYSGVSTNTPNTLVFRDASGNFSANVITASLAGNAATVTNGVYTSGSYSNPSWISSLDGSKITGTISCTVSSTIPWTQISGRPTNVSQLNNDSGYITGTGSTTGASGSVTGQTSAATASKVMVRDASGRAQVAAPAVSADIATKGYVDASSGGGGNNISVFNTAGSYTWTCPSNKNYIDVLLIGSGAAGSGAWVWDGTHEAPGYGGGGGQVVFIKRLAVNPNQTYTVTVAAAPSPNLTIPANYSAFIGSGMGTNVYNSVVSGNFSQFDTLFAQGGYSNGNAPYGYGGGDPDGYLSSTPGPARYDTIGSKMLSSAGSPSQLLVIPAMIGESFMIIGGIGGIPWNVSSTNSSGGGGGAAGGYFQYVASPGITYHNATGSVIDTGGGAWKPNGGVPSFLLQHLFKSLSLSSSVGFGAGYLQTAGYGGGGAGAGQAGSTAGFNNSSSYPPGSGLVAIFY